jgi:hypothetical protein
MIKERICAGIAVKGRGSTPGANQDRRPKQTVSSPTFLRSSPRTTLLPDRPQMALAKNTGAEIVRPKQVEQLGTANRDRRS